MRFVSGITGNILATFAVMIALALSGFAHQGAGATTAPGYAAYVAAGGSIADLCGDTSGSPKSIGAKCEACRLIGAAIVPCAATGLALHLSDPVSVGYIVPRLSVHPGRSDPSHPARAPPLA